MFSNTLKELLDHGEISIHVDLKKCSWISSLNIVKFFHSKFSHVESIKAFSRMLQVKIVYDIDKNY